MVYGPNIVSVEGHEWLHHRKFTVSAFSERNNKLVWAESLNQAFDMLETWESISTTSNGVKAYRPDLQLNFTSIALHVMSMAGFGVPMKFTSEKPKNLDDIELFADGSTPPKGFTFSFRDALTFITTNFMQHTLVFFMLPSWFPKTWFSSIKRHHSAHADFGRYMKTIVSSSGEASIKQLGRSENNLRDLLIAGGKLYSENPNDGAKGLTSPELMGNLFVFIIAGQETTASLLYYAMLMLAIYPKKQQWVYENVAKTLEGESRDFREWKYEEVFPKLVSPLCLMVTTSLLYLVPGLTSLARNPPPVCNGSIHSEDHLSGGNRNP